MKWQIVFVVAIAIIGCGGPIANAEDIPHTDGWCQFTTGGSLSYPSEIYFTGTGTSAYVSASFDGTYDVKNVDTAAHTDSIRTGAWVSARPHSGGDQIFYIELLFDAVQVTLQPGAHQALPGRNCSYSTNFQLGEYDASGGGEMTAATLGFGWYTTNDTKFTTVESGDPPGGGGGG